ncbi:ABC transporter substrate-binding protein [Pelagibaculum spongiae]|uniref:Peptide ABC transporter substrate-binding protein n=1 Tax=Pelagibaculum spongiae TaxID=2080658 RepID=A0A2V1GWT2_9GAMM|nr:ABC transporter substrate-binding protein [Pelagibaculum spongiae]PVZ65489.1 peptide ABC transporter substrate-binding protein [Pelagibaculum spongiae]
MSFRTNLCALGAGLLVLTACGEGTWNNPNPTAESDQKVLYSSFALRPKHLDPARAYSSDESTFIDQIYEPPLQYHYLKRPYELEPLTLTEMPKVSYFDGDGNSLPADVMEPAYSVYQLNLKKGIMYQPHAAFAKNADGTPFYDIQSIEESAKFKSLDDFTQTATKELVAQDYIYQIKRLADPKRLAPLRGLLSEYIVGMSEFSQQVKDLRKDLQPNDWLDLDQLDMQGVNLIDDHTFTIKLKGKYPQFKYWLAFHFFAPVPVEADRFYHQPGLPEKNISLDWMPVGTGAYMMSKNNPNSQIILSRNPNYHDEFYPDEGEAGDEEKGLLADAGKRVPFVDQIVFRLEKEAIPIWTKFLQGYYDRSGISSDSFDQAVNVSIEGIGLSDEMIAKGITLNRAVEPSTYYTGFNMLDPVVGGYTEQARKLRQAIAIVWNEEEYITIFRNGRGETSQSPVPPGFFGYKSGEAGINPVVFDWVDGEAKRKSIETAKQLLAEAGYPNGRSDKTGKPLSLNFDTTAGGSTKARLNWMSKQFQKLGIQLNFRITDFNRFKDKMKTGNSQVFGYGWLADYPDPENFLFLLHSEQGQVASGGAGVNASNYKNEKYDRLFEQMRTMENTPERQQVIDEMLNILRHDTPWASAFHSHSYVLNNQWVKNAKPHGISKATLKYLNVDVDLRKQKQSQWNQPIVWPLVMVFLILAALIIPGYLSFKRRQTRKIGG